MPSYEQLDKVLALADSDHDGEALVAVRKARQLLSRNGLSFSDLATAALSQRPRLRGLSIFSSPAPSTHYEVQLQQMRQRLDDLENEIHNQSIQTEFWRRRATELEQNLNLSTEQSSRWKELARETVEKLWDLGQSIKIEEFDASKAQTLSPAQRKTA